VRRPQRHDTPSPTLDSTATSDVSESGVVHTAGPLILTYTNGNAMIGCLERKIDGCRIALRERS
jgi:hypothetical protein